MSTNGRKAVMDALDSTAWAGWVPTLDRVLVKRDTDSPDKVGSLYVPEMAKEKPTRGTVVAVGPGIVGPLPVKVGDDVLFGQYSGTSLSLDSQEIVVLQWADVLCAKAI